MRILIAIGALAGLGLLFVLRPARAPAVLAVPSSDTPMQLRPAPRPSASEAAALVYVAGEVVRPGVYAIGADARVRDALARAGGMRPSADPAAVNLAAHVRDGDEILVEPRGASGQPHRSRHRGSGRRRAHGHRRESQADAQASRTPIDLNRADAGSLARIPGIGAGLAARIVAFRTTNGPFASPDGLLDVAGITDRRLDTVLPYVVVR